MFTYSHPLLYFVLDYTHMYNFFLKTFPRDLLCTGEFRRQEILFAINSLIWEGEIRILYKNDENKQNNP